MAKTASIASSRTSKAKPVVLVTGASGFIGRAVIERLSAKYVLVGLDRAGPPDPPAPAKAVDIDLASNESVAAALDDVRSRFGTRIASVVHLAAYYDISGEPNPLYDKITVKGTRLRSSIRSLIESHRILLQLRSNLTQPLIVCGA